MLDLAGPELEFGCWGFIPELETTIEDAFAEANINETVDLDGSELIINLSPADALVSTDGLRISFDGSVSQTPSLIVLQHTTQWLTCDPRWPTQYWRCSKCRSNANLRYADDFLNQALYTVWRSEHSLHH